MRSLLTTQEVTAKIMATDKRVRLSSALIAQLEQWSGAKFSEPGHDHIAQMEEILTLYKCPDDLPPWMISTFSIDDFSPISQQQSKRRAALVEHLFITWRDAGGSGHGGGWDFANKSKQGAFVRFVQKLFDHIGEKRPSGRTVRRDLESFRRELEPVGHKRKIGRKYKTTAPTT